MEITNEQIKQQVARGKLYTLRIFKTGPRRDQPQGEAERVQLEHLRYLFGLKAQGILPVNGPVDDPLIRGISIFNTTDLDHVRQLSEADPAVQAGRLIYEVYPWFGLPGDGLPISDNGA